MGFFNGSANIARFYLKSDLRYSDIIKHLYSNRISPLELKDVKLSTYGWCSADSGDSEFTMENLSTMGIDHLYFGFRVDEKKVPGTAVRVHVRNALKDWEHNGKKPSQKIRKSIKDQIITSLTQSTVPSIRIFGILWNPKTGEFLTECTSASTLNSISSLVEATFKTHLTPVNTGVVGINLLSPNPSDIEFRLDMMPIRFGGVNA
jgi:DNA recombination-dependent growth factor C